MLCLESFKALHQLLPDTVHSSSMEFACGGAAGVFATVLTHPLDTSAVLRQTQQQGQLAGWRKRSVSSTARLFYRGLAPACFQASLIYGVMFGVYESLRGPEDEGGYGCSLLTTAAVVALPESAIKGPLESLKNLRQTNKLPTPSGSLFPSRALTGILLTGTALMLAREVPGNVAYFAGFEAVRGAPPRARGASLLQHMAGGAGAATAFTVFLYPIDTYRAQVVTGTPWRDARPSYRGVGFYWFRCVAFTSLLFAGWETSREWCLDVEDGGGASNANTKKLED